MSTPTLEAVLRDELGDLSTDHRDDKAVIRSLRRELSEMRQQLALMSAYRNMAYRDFLTGALNRRSFDERLREETARAARTPGYSFAVVLADVDDLKLVNDTLGHAVGDEVLVGVARFLADNVRAVDLAFRLGGDEFAILLPHTDEAGTRVVVGRLRAAFAAARDQLPFPVGLSLGAATTPPSPFDVDAILERADTEMYLDKRNNKAAGRRASNGDDETVPGTPAALAGSHRNAA